MFLKFNDVNLGSGDDNVNLPHYFNSFISLYSDNIHPIYRLVMLSKYRKKTGDIKETDPYLITERFRYGIHKKFLSCECTIFVTTNV